MLNEFGTYAGTSDSTKNDLTTKPVETNYCTNGTDIARPPNLSIPTAASWNYPYLSNFYNYYTNNSYDLSDVHQYDNQKCGSQFPRNYSQHPTIQSASVLQCCDPRCQLLSEHSKYPFNHSLNNKLNQRIKRSKNYGGVIDMPKGAPIEPLPKPPEHAAKYSHCSVSPYPLQNDLNGKYHNQQTDYGTQYYSAIKPSKHVLIPDSTSFGEYYTDIGKPSYWNKQNIWHRNVPNSYYPPHSFEQDKGINQKISATPAIHEQNIAAAVSNQRGILFNRLLEHRDCSYDSSFVPNYYYDKQNQLSKNINEYSSQAYLNRDHHLYGDVGNNTRLPLQNNNNNYHHHPLSMYNLHYPQESLPATSYKETPTSVPVATPVTSSSSLAPLAKELQSKHSADEKSRILEKNPNLDVREFLSTWDDDVEDDKLPDSNVNEAPVIVLDCSTLDSDVLAKVKEKLSENISNCPLENNAAATNMCEQFNSMGNATVLKIIENDEGGNILSPHANTAQDVGNTTAAESSRLTEKINELKNDSCHLEKSPSEFSHLSSDGFLTWYSNTKKKDDLSYDLVEMTERLVNTVDKLFSEPEKKTNPKPSECVVGAEYDTRNTMTSTELSLAGDANDKNPLSENEWNINFNYKKSKNIVAEKSTSLPSPSANVIPALNSESQQRNLPMYNQFASSKSKENSFSNSAEVMTPTFKNYPSVVTYVDERKNPPLPTPRSMTNEKNVSCSFNLQKTSNDLKFSVNYSKQATQCNMSKAQDFSIKYKNVDSYPQYNYQRYKTAPSTNITTTTTPTKTIASNSNEFYKNYPIYNNSCCYNNELSCNYNNLSSACTSTPESSKECTSMNYVEHIEKNMNTANDTDITLVKADLEKSLKEITHQFSQKQNAGRTNDVAPIDNKVHSSNMNMSFHDIANYLNNKNAMTNEIKDGISCGYSDGKINSVTNMERTANTISCEEKPSDQTFLYNGVIQKAGQCSLKLYESEKQNEDPTSVCENSLLSMPSLTPPASPKINSINVPDNSDTKQKSIGGVNLTLNDVYENDVIFDTDEPLNSQKHETEKCRAENVCTDDVTFEVDKICSKNITSDGVYQPLNLALSKNAKKYNISSSLDTGHSSLLKEQHENTSSDNQQSVEKVAKKNQQLNICNTYERISHPSTPDVKNDCTSSSITCSNSSTTFADDRSLDSHTSKIDDGYYSAENKTDSCDVDVDDDNVKKKILNIEKIPAQTMLNNQTCTVSQKHHKNVLEQEVISDEGSEFVNSCKSESKTFANILPHVQDLSAGSVDSKELISSNSFQHHKGSTAVTEHNDINGVNMYSEESSMYKSTRCENETIQKLDNENILTLTENCEKNIDNLEPVINSEKNMSDQSLMDVGTSAEEVDITENVHRYHDNANALMLSPASKPPPFEEVHKSYGNWEDSVPLDNVLETNSIRRLTQTYEKLSECEVSDYREVLLSTAQKKCCQAKVSQYDEGHLTKKYKHKHKKFKLKKSYDCDNNLKCDNESELYLEKMDARRAINGDSEAFMNFSTNSIIKENGNHVLQRHSQNLKDNDNKFVGHVKNFESNLSQDSDQHEKCAKKTDTISIPNEKSSCLNGEMNADSLIVNALSESKLLNRDDSKIDDRSVQPANGDINKFAEKQNLNSVESEYVKLKKRKFAGSSSLAVRDADLPMKKRKQDFECITSQLPSSKTLCASNASCTDSIAKINDDLHTKSNIENERYFLNGVNKHANHEDQSFDKKNIATEPLPEEYANHTRKYKHKHKKEKIKSKSSKKKFKKLKRRFSLNEKSYHRRNEKSLKYTSSKHFKHSKSLNQFSFDEKTTADRCKEYRSVILNEYTNLHSPRTDFRFPFKSIEAPLNGEINAKFCLEKNFDLSNDKCDVDKNSNMITRSPGFIKCINNDSEQDEPDFARNTAIDDEIFNIPSTAPTPNCDLIRDDNTDVEERKTPDISCEVVLDTNAENKERTIPCLAYSAPTLYCDLKHEKLHHNVENDKEVCCKSSVLEKCSTYSTENCENLTDGSDIFHSSKAPSPNCILNNYPFAKEKEFINAPLPNCVINDMTTFSDDCIHDIVTDKYEEDSDSDNFSSVAPSPNCNIIEGVLLDDSDYSKNCDELVDAQHENEEESVMLSEQSERNNGYQMPSLQSLATNAVSKMKLSSTLKNDNRNRLEVWVTSERTEIIIHAEDQEPADVVFSNGDASNLIITEAAAVSTVTTTTTTTTYDDEVNISTNFEKEKEISFDYPTTTLEPVSSENGVEKNDDDLQCQCLIISSEESILCLRCSLNSSVIVNHEDRLETDYCMSINESNVDEQGSNKERKTNPCFPNECIEESIVDQKINCISNSNENLANERLNEIISPVCDTQNIGHVRECEEENKASITLPAIVDHKFQIKVKLPWHKIFNLNDEDAVSCDEQRILELGPAQIEVRLSSDDSEMRKVVNSNNGNVSPVVKVKRLVLQRAAKLNNDNVKSWQRDNKTDQNESSSNVLVDVSTDSEEAERSVKNSEISGILRLPKMVIRKTSCREYKSYLRTNNILQPVVRLFKSKSLDELALKFCRKSSNDATINLKEIGRSLTTEWNTNFLECEEKKRDAVAEVDQFDDEVSDSEYSADASVSEETVESRSIAKPERHHCLLCHRSYSSGELYYMHVKSRFHHHLELTQRKTIHALYRHFTGRICPRLRPLSAKERKKMKWKPRSANVNHFYHQKTPLQIALHKSVFDNK